MEEKGRPMDARKPRQSRGQARVDGILNAAAEMVAEDGLAAVTMHALARRAGTSIGSMYHFFPDRQSVLDALSERHACAIQEISRQLREVPAMQWRELSPGSAIDSLVTPYINYLRCNADYLPLMHGRDSPDSDAEFIRVVLDVLEARLPKVEPAVRENHAAVLHATAAGIMHVGYRADPLRAELYLREIPRVLTAYLACIEAAAGP